MQTEDNAELTLESRRVIAAALLRLHFGRAAEPLEIARALAGLPAGTDLAALAQAITEAYPPPPPPPPDDAIRARAELEAIQASIFWRATQPLRDVAELVPKPVRGLLRAAARRTPKRQAAPVEPAEVFPPPANPETAERNARAWCGGDAPVVSIIILNWNAAALTADCVRHVWAHTTGTPYEIIIVDNGSAPDDLEMLRALGSRVRLLPLGINRYFGEANTIAAERARGEFICFLNNDAFVRDFWLDPLLAAMRAEPALGAAGPKLLYADGSLQEAGCVLNPDGHPDRLGRHGDPGGAEYNIAREVDYVSAATLLVNREAFLAAGGFDPAFEPAYYEDVDLCLRLRAAGRPTLYCPATEIVHLEASTSDDPARGAWRAALSTVNRSKLLDRWGPFLATRDPNSLVAPKPFTPPHAAGQGRRVVIWIPFALRPGSLPRLALHAAAALSARDRVELRTSHRYSAARLGWLARAFGLDLSRVTMRAIEDARDAPLPDFRITIGDAGEPDAPLRGKRDAHLRLDVGAVGIGGRILPLPVALRAGDAARKSPMIVCLGRFAPGRGQDALLDAFRLLRARHAGNLQLCLLGTVRPDDVSYLAMLREAAADLDAAIHADPPPAMIASILHRAALAWHPAGRGLALAETMRAACVPLVLPEGPQSMVRDGETGFHAATRGALVARSLALLADDATRTRIGAAAAQASAVHDCASFAAALAEALEGS